MTTNVSELRVGVDVVDVGQLEQMLAGDPMFQQLCWTSGELALCHGAVDRLAARWAAKEAVMKALGRGIGEIEPTDIEVVGGEGEQPGIRLHGSAALAAAELGALDWALSLSHDGGIAIAFVIAQFRPPNGPGQVTDRQLGGPR